ncbi:MAG: sensor histidine kinase N-terminal domain-containing protein [Ottowia sp.]|nr:sensor histidine kinase N-terminal domain-containing protein [Ottowia sp.]MBP7458435.1 sensor histidine kinase N-terminal domain-containing protein [Ottowia sp.]MBP8895377.1 sensor histidine kinase N-terminal domain-containing protein [Ottowia sp.]MBP9522387.1 sensor histidine kinase N-terminal domain-containing protein [Ottowia sp.]
MKHEPKPAPSLRARLTGALLLAVLAFAALQAAVTYRTARAETEALFDAQMQRIALSLSGSLGAGALSDDAPAAETPAAREMIIQIWRADGVMLYRSPQGRLLPPQTVIGFSDTVAGGEPYRIYALRTATQVVQVAQQTEARGRMAGQLALRAVLPVALLAPVLMLIVWWVVGRAIGPIERVRRQVAARRPDDLAPLPTAGLPAEVRPLVGEMNGLLTRLSAAWDALTHFTADAAHELRSPLAALRLQAQSLQRAPDDATRAIATERLLAGIDRATRLVEQLLALARQEGAGEGAELVSLDLTALARNALADAEPEAARHAIALTLDAPTAHVVLRADEAALAVLLRNLLGNALRHTPPGGQVRVGVREEASVIDLTVEDSGPGIAPDERARVLDRFYRVPGTPGHGSGLGLAIVRAIAERHGAALTLDASPTLGGLRVMLRWPAV